MKVRGGWPYPCWQPLSLRMQSWCRWLPARGGRAGELCGTGIAVGPAGPWQQGAVKVQSIIKMSWQPGLGVLVGANGREMCRTRPGSRKTLQSLLQVRVCSSTAESRLREGFTSGDFFPLSNVSIYFITGIEVCCSCCFLLIPSMASLVADFLQAASSYSLT